MSAITVRDFNRNVYDTVYMVCARAKIYTKFLSCRGVCSSLYSYCPIQQTSQLHLSGNRLTIRFTLLTMVFLLKITIHRCFVTVSLYADIYLLPHIYRYIHCGYIRRVLFINAADKRSLFVLCHCLSFRNYIQF